MQKRMKTREALRAAALVGAMMTTLALAGCGSDEERAELVGGPWDAVVAAAEDEGEVSLYTGTSPAAMDRLIKAFGEKYPDITVDGERIAADGIARVEAQIKTGTEGADVFVHADSEWYRGFEDDLTKLPDDAPGRDGLSDDAWIIPDVAAKVSGAPYSLYVWNTEIFPDGFDDWQDLLDPSVKGQLAMRNTASASAAGFLDFLTENFGDDYLKALGEQEPKLYPSIVPMTQAVGAGEAGVTIASSPADAMALQDAGAPVEFAETAPAYGIDYMAAALDNARNPNAAAVLLDFMLSPEGQAALNGDGLGIAYREDVPGDVDAEGYTMLDATRYTPEETAKWQEKIDTYFG